MDIFKKMAKNKETDLNMFRMKRSAKGTVQSQVLENKEAPMPKNDLEKEEKQSNPVTETTEEPRIMEEEKRTEEPARVIQFKKPENQKEEAAIKLEAELETAKSTLLPVFPIVRYLKNKCLSDEVFAELVNNEKKTLAKCFSYVTNEVKKALNSKNGWLDDNEVYAYAETYYMTDEAVFEQIEAKRAEAEKKRQEEVAKKRKEQEEKRKKANAAKKKKEGTEPKKVEKEIMVPEPIEQPVMQEQLCLHM